MKNRNAPNSDDWATPPALFEELHSEFRFDFDPCPLDPPYDGLSVEWGMSNFVNPPYSQDLKEAFVNKALEESYKGKLCVLLLPVSTSTRLFHDVILPNAADIRFIRGRIPFIGINTKGQYVNFHLDPSREAPYAAEHVRASGQHDSMIVIFPPRT